MVNFLKRIVYKSTQILAHEDSGEKVVFEIPETKEQFKFFLMNL